MKTLKGEGVEAEVASEGEIFLSLMAGFNPKGIIFNGPAKSDRELAISANLGLYSINLDSVDELERLYTICKRLGKVARISFRVRPDVEAGTKIIQTGTEKSKFGLGVTETLEAYRRASMLGDYLKIAGIHAHVGSQNTSLNSWRDFVRKLAALTVRLRDEYGIAVNHVDIGGGLPARHFTDDLNQPTPSFMKSVPSDDEIADTVKEALSESGVQDIELVVEPGRRIVQTAGLLITKVISTKKSGAEDWIYVDAGFNTLPSASLPWYYHMLPVTKADETELIPYRVAGPLCDGKDLFHDLHGEEMGNPSLPEHRMLPKGLHNGDFLALLDVGAYNLGLMDNFNGRLMASAIFIDKHGKLTIMRRRQRYEDLLLYEQHSKNGAVKIAKRIERAAAKMK